MYYTPHYDDVNVATLSADLRAETGETPPVVLGQKNPFKEDELDTSVGVVSNAPTVTLVRRLFELLCSGGSESILRRLWNQFRATIPVESTYAQATWSKTEPLVIVSQTLYPCVLCRVQSWCKLHSSVFCFVRMIEEFVALSDVKLVTFSGRCACCGSLILRASVTLRFVVCHMFCQCLLIVNLPLLLDFVQRLH